MNEPMTNETRTFQLTAPDILSDGKTYARFRFSTQAGLAPTGLANDGEVEDYEVNLQTNAPPVVVSDFIVRFHDQSVKVSEKELLANDFDPEGGPLTFLDVSTSLPSGAHVKRDNGWIIYEPPPGYNLPDSFNYLISDSSGATALGTVIVELWVDDHQPTANFICVNSVNGNVLVRFAGIPGRRYEIQTTSSLIEPIIWISHPAGPQVAQPNGIFQIIDPAPPSPRFYRALQL